VRAFLGIVAAEVLDELVAAIETRSAERALALVHRLLAEGQNLQQFCREAVAHFRNLLVARVCGADSELVAAPAEERPRLARAAAAFSEEDLTRFFQILLLLEEDLRKKPDPRLHLEMGLLRMVNTARLAPLEELLSELSGQPAMRTKRTNSLVSDVKPLAETFSTSVPTSRASAAGPAPATRSAPSATPVSAPPESQTAPVEAASAVAPPAVVLTATAQAAEADLRSPVPVTMPSMIARTADPASGLDAAQVATIKSAILSQQKFLGELVEAASRWELEGGEIRLYFPTESRALAELLQGRESMERLRTISSRVLGRQLRVCVKLEAAPMLGSTVRAAQGARELRARFEQDPIVRAMLERFGGRISEVKRRDEE
jgi:DNA polymerase III gamma/tau subunit